MLRVDRLCIGVVLIIGVVIIGGLGLRVLFIRIGSLIFRSMNRGLRFFLFVGVVVG